MAFSFFFSFSPFVCFEFIVFSQEESNVILTSDKGGGVVIGTRMYSRPFTFLSDIFDTCFSESAIPPPPGPPVGVWMWSTEKEHPERIPSCLARMLLGPS